MNCDEYRQAISAEPGFDGGASHLSECEACRAYRRDILAMDETIGRALAIGVPAIELPALPDIEAANVTVLRSPRRGRFPAWLALAASVAIAAVIGIRMLGSDVAFDSLADEVIAHLDHEPAALVVTDKAVGDRRLARVVPADIARLDHSAGLITYARSCEINGNTVPHLVIQGERGPVTILLMPDETIDAAEHLSGDHISGVLLPVGSGSIAIIGERGERIEPIKDSIVNSVMWDI